MCFDLYVHNTAREHDTRHLSIINPVTGYTVYSPWQDPCVTLRCNYPHRLEQIPLHQSCPFHPGCCRLERHFVCRFKDGSCQTQVKYHHFVDKANGETNDISFLSAYFGYNPSLLFLASWFFKAGVELALADKYRGQMSERLSEAAEWYINPAERINLEAQHAHLTRVITCSREVLGQFATLWDRNVGLGALPPRPGGDPDPERNVTLSSKLNLRTDGWVKIDDSQYFWPHLIQLWPEFEAGILNIHDDPSIVSWSLRGENQMEFTGMHYVNSSNPDPVVFNSGTPTIRAASPFPGNVEESLNIKDQAKEVASTPASLTSSPLTSPPSSESDFHMGSD